MPREPRSVVTMTLVLESVRLLEGVAVLAFCWAVESEVVSDDDDESDSFAKPVKEARSLDWRLGSVSRWKARASMPFLMR